MFFLRTRLFIISYGDNSKFWGPKFSRCKVRKNLFYVHKLRRACTNFFHTFFVFASRRWSEFGKKGGWLFLSAKWMGLHLDCAFVFSLDAEETRFWEITPFFSKSIFF